jgi:hypothetical protein
VGAGGGLAGYLGGLEAVRPWTNVRSVHRFRITQMG